MSDAGSSVISVRAVRGRAPDPFRGSLDDDADARTDRAVEPQPFADVERALRASPEFTVAKTDRRFELARNETGGSLAIASRAADVALADLRLQGDPQVAIHAMHALLPVFGPVELRAGSFSAVVDAHEKPDDIAGRYRLHFVQDMGERFEQIAGLFQRVRVAAEKAKEEEAERLRQRARGGGAVATIAIVGVLVIAVVAGCFLWLSHRGAAVGERCAANNDCRSNECLPDEVIEPTVVGGVDLTAMSPPATHSSRGLCTTSCDDDRDCPAMMVCGPVMVYGGIVSIGRRESRCVPAGRR